jgi:hypothetical protein
VAAAFVDVLELARALRRLKLGCVSLDGTHLRASASKDKNVPYQRAGELRAQLRLDVGALLAQAEASDRADADPQALPKEPSFKSFISRASSSTSTNALATASKFLRRKSPIVS